MFWKAAKTSALLTVLFLVVYGGTNYLTSLRHDVGTWVYGWEHLIPFVPIFIIPYMSIDLFFVAAPFVCRDQAERNVLARRVALAIGLAGAFFLLMPLRFSFSRPHVDGVLGAIFDQFRQMDQPYNLVPSLHIALAAILVETYSRHARGLLRAGVLLWFCLIALSTLLAYQHHVVDVIGGGLLAGVCFYLVRPSPWRLPVSANATVGAYCGIGVAVLLITALILRPWGLWLLWPSMSLALVCGGYCGLGPGIFAKSAGHPSLSARLALWPVLVGQHLSLRHYARRCRPWDKLTENLWIGRKLTDREAADAVSRGVSAVVDLTGEFSEADPFLAIPHLSIQVLDLTAPTPQQCRQAVDFIRQHAAAGIVYIHCKIGYSRTAAVAAAYLLDAGLADDAQQAMQRLREARPSIVIRPEAVRLIQSWQLRPVQVN